MQRRGMKFWLLWGITVVSFSAGCTASKRVKNCIAGAMIGAGVGAAIGAGTGGNNHEHSDNAMLGRRNWRGCWWCIGMFTDKRRSRSRPGSTLHLHPRLHRQNQHQTHQHQNGLSFAVSTLTTISQILSHSLFRFLMKRRKRSRTILTSMSPSKAIQTRSDRTNTTSDFPNGEHKP